MSRPPKPADHTRGASPPSPPQPRRRSRLDKAPSEARDQLCRNNRDRRRRRLHAFGGSLGGGAPQVSVVLAAVALLDVEPAAVVAAVPEAVPLVEVLAV